MRFIRAPRVPALGQRTLALLIALALQISFLLLLVQAVLKPSLMVRQLARELTLTLRPLPAPRQQAPFRPVRPAPQITAIRPEVAPPAQAPSPSSVIPIVPPGALQGFGQALNNCAPQNYANLPEDQKTLCTRPGAGVAVQQAPNLMGVPSQVKDPARWADALAHEHSAPWLPCTYIIVPEFGPGGPAPAFSLPCLVKAFSDGTITDPASWPTYETKQLQQEDFYKIQQAYDEWHAAHAKAPTK